MSVKGLMIVSLSFLVFFGCEADKVITPEEDTPVASLIGTWACASQGDYANADCTGDIDYSEWEAMVLDGFALSITLNENGSGAVTFSEGSQSGTEEFTWTAAGGILCITQDDDEEPWCNAYTLDGSTLTMTDQEDGVCEDDDGSETEYTETECEGMADHTWQEAECELSTWTKS